MKQQSFAEAIEHRYRKTRWRSATVEYVGGGWFKLRLSGYPAHPSKLRRKELLSNLERQEKENAE